jgi:hypothetical protein
MRIVERIEDQIASTNLPLVGITLAAVPCPDTPVILTLHWHGFIKEKLVDLEEAETVSYTPIPSSALQVNDRWQNLLTVDRAAMDAGWRLGAWDVSRAERPGCMRPGVVFPGQPLGFLSRCLGCAWHRTCYSRFASPMSLTPPRRPLVYADS